MIIVEANQDTEAGVMPEEKLIATMTPKSKFASSSSWRTSVPARQ
jgi:hypothetical protein